MRLLRVAFVVLVVVFLGRVVLRHAEELRQVSLDVDIGRLMLATVFGALTAPVLPLAWRAVVAATGHRLDPFRAVRTWYLGQTGRFVPTALPAFAARAALTPSVPASTVVATVVVELGLIVAVGVAAAVVVLPADAIEPPLRVALAVATAAGLLAGPFVLRAIAPRIPRLSVRWGVPGLYRSEALFVANALVKGIAFCLLVRAFLPVRWGDVPLLVGALNAAAVLGTVGVTPAGLGVREGVLAALLRGRYGLGDAAAVAIVLRVWELAIEGLWLLVVQLPRFRRRPGDSGGEAEEQRDQPGPG